MPRSIKKPVKKQSAKRTGAEDIPVYSDLREGIARRKKTFVSVAVTVAAVLAVAAGLYFHHESAVARANYYNARGYAVFYGLSPETPAAGAQRYAQALSWFEKAYGARASAYSLYYIGASRYELGQYDQAVKALSRVRSLYPDDAQFVPLSLYKTAMIELQLGKKGEALKYLRMMENSRFDALKDMAYYEDARLLESMGKKDAASRKFEELIGKFPQSPYAVDIEAQRAAGKAPSKQTPKPAR
ncbi:MAG: tetratricopeptide repeat protein [Nitrospiraceae bacterium]|nr:tetratricopeptide repeat protein [Nitrospiraceae bacterium]